MLVLGWHGSLKSSQLGDGARFDGHDAAAVLLKDGKIVAAIEEERLNRLKHSNAFPSNAIRHCLSEAGVEISDLDAIVTDHMEETILDFARRQFFYNPNEKNLNATQWIARLFEKEFDTDVSCKIKFCPHHLAHMYAAWYTSGFTEALGVCLDGGGDGRSGLIAKCEGGKIEVLRHLSQTHSLGIFYICAIGYLGYHLFDEYKVMGLAPYGNPAVYAHLFDKMYELRPDGHVEIAPVFDLYKTFDDAGFVEKARRKEDNFTQDHKDYAAALQKALERMSGHIIDFFADATDARNLCLTGGVAQNCSMNGEILKSRRFDRVYVQPASHDAGNALGAAISFLQESGYKIRGKLLPNLYLGKNIGASAEIRDRLFAWRGCLNYRRSTNIHRDAANFIAEGNVIGWVQGRAEFGPRALGNRSILADPRPAENKTIINAMIKKREGYRPFAPSVLEEDLHEFFEMPDRNDTAPFMVVTLPVKNQFREMLGAVTHVDGSARVQSVSRSDNSDFHKLISEFRDVTGLPILLNTSFNNNFEPIVDSVDDAITCFLTTDLDKLIISDWIIDKISDPPLLELTARLSPGWKISCNYAVVKEDRFTVEPTAAVLSGSPSVTISRYVFDILTSDCDRDIISHCAAAGMAVSSQLEQVSSEIFNLWQRRMIVLSPKNDGHPKSSQQDLAAV